MVNKLSHSKLQGFTLVELIVAMIISTIVISSTIAIWLTVEGLFKRGMSDTYGDTGTVLFVSCIKTDMYRSENITASAHEIHFSFSEDPEIVYTFDDDYTVRTVQNSIDTFYVGIQDLQIIPHKTLPKVVKSISFSVLLKNKIIPFFLTKDYSNSRLFNYQIEQNEP